MYTSTSLGQWCDFRWQYFLSPQSSKWSLIEDSLFGCLVSPVDAIWADLSWMHGPTMIMACTFWNRQAAGVETASRSPTSTFWAQPSPPPVKMLPVLLCLVRGRSVFTYKRFLHMWDSNCLSWRIDCQGRCISQTGLSENQKWDCFLANSWKKSFVGMKKKSLCTHSAIGKLNNQSNFKQFIFR